MKMTLSFFSSAAVLAALTLSAKALLGGPTVVIAPPTQQASSSGIVAVDSAPTPSAPKPQPGSVRITMPFSSQAPFANWDAMHEETCEEASLVLVKTFLDGKATITEQEMENELQMLVKWQTDHGYGQDVTMDELGKTAVGAYGLRYRVIDATKESIETELAAGNPVIIPAAGRELGNPYFSGEGPWYHVLVVSGFDASSYYTQDVGTKRGANYRYDKDTLLAALHDWTGVKEATNTGSKRALVVTK